MQFLVKRIATYERVSSEDQRERETIRTQTEELARRLAMDPDVQLVERYVDDGVSGTIPMAERPAGRRLLDDAIKGRFDEVWVYRIDRLGRDDVDPLVVWQELEKLGVKVHSVTEGVSTLFEYHIRVAMAAEERRGFLARSAAGMARAAREGRYCGGIVPMGYKVEGHKQSARLVASDAPIWRGWTEADLVRNMYDWLVEGWSCRRIADHLNALGVPTSYVKDNRLVAKRRGERKQQTQGRWRPGRIRNLIVNPVYKGEYHYGRRSTKANREVIVALVPALVTPEIWEAAQETLARNRVIAKHGSRVHLLRSVMRCNLCGLTFSGTMGRNVGWYRCNGQIVYRGKFEGRCRSKSIRSDWLEPLVWRDVERFLREPGDIIDELVAERSDTSGAAVLEAERVGIEQALTEIPAQHDRVLEAFRRGHMTPADLDRQMEAVANEEKALRIRHAELTPSEPYTEDMLDADLLQEIRQRLDEGVHDVKKRDIISLLVQRIDVNTEDVGGRKRATIVIHYRFPAVVGFSRDRGSWRRRA
jgi:site-specific DNA recombinase